MISEHSRSRKLSQEDNYSKDNSFALQRTPRSRFSGTQSKPFKSVTRRVRFDKQSDRIISQGSEYENSVSQDRQDTYFGTNISIEKCQKSLRDFIEKFTLDAHEEETEPFYVKRLEILILSNGKLLNVDANHIFSFDKALYYQLINFPSDIILLFDQVINEIFESLLQNEEPWQVEVAITNLKNTIRVRELSTKDIHKLRQIRGIVIRCSEIYPEMREATFKCTICHNHLQASLQNGKIQEPITCPICKNQFTYEIMHNQCTFIDKQYVKIQETPESVPDGETPQTVNLISFGCFVDQVRPGDRIDVTGIYRATGQKLTTSKRTLKSIYKTYVDVISFKAQEKRFVDQDGLVKEAEQEYFSQETIQEIHNIAQSDQIYEQLVQSIAPSIWGNDDLKKGVLCMLFGGTQKHFSQSGKGRFRGDINCLMIGDPSTAKSQMLTYVNRIAPRGIYTSGKGSSAVGLTAYISKDPETKEFILESGALVLSDRGVCCIDEFDKMDDNTKTILHEAMEQQTISVAKAGIVCSLNARTSLLASANPVDSRYNPKLSVIQNIKLPPSLLSRFDLIYLMLDNTNEVHDRRLASHILSLYGVDRKHQEKAQMQFINSELLTKYISYSRQRIHPVLSDQACEDLVNVYKDMRRLGMGKNIITATPRQLESLIRISEALAKMRLSNIVESHDVEEAYRLIRVATQQTATDPTTGLIDMDVINTGMSAGVRQKIDKISEKIQDYIVTNGEQLKSGIKFDEFKDIIAKELEITEGQQYNFTQEQFLESINRLTAENVLRKEGPNKKPKLIRLGNK